MHLDFGFFPDPVRARRLDARMHAELGKSLAYICEQCRGVAPFDEAGMAGLTEGLARGATAAPSTFARYYELVDALYGDDLDSAARLFRELVAAEPPGDQLQIVSLGDAALGEDSDRYYRMMNADPSLDLGFQIPRPEAAAAFRGRLAGGLRLLEIALPTLAAEVRAIVRQIVIAGGDPSKTYQFDGGSHYQLWGALFLNGDFHPDDVAVAEVLAHESAHSLLFGFCTDEPLVTNDDEDLYASPLRADLRPMDGIYHATFVSARMHWAMSQLAASEAIGSADRKRAREAALSDSVNFDAGYGVVMQHGLLTSIGRGLMASAKDYMDLAR